ncbi:MAG: ABC transporter ATP-binding protein [Desulfomonile tiedjei]|nr:ABC transporter ATP-binding protein [Desulfomonile tiedjei]
MIEVQALHCGYGSTEVLKGISLKVPAGEMAGLLGPNGSGKTTLLLALTGVLPIRSGSIRVEGVDISRQDSRWKARLMASVPQRSEFAFPFKCLSVVLMGRYPHLDSWGGYSPKDLEVAVSALEETKISHLAQRYIGEVSGGEAQMVMVARALAQETEILLLDEATSNLDVARKVQVFDLLAEKNRQGGTMLCVMHDLNLAALYCRRLIFLKSGRVAADGKTEDVFNDRNLSEIYETEIRVSRHPITGSPQAHFVPNQGRVGVGGDSAPESGAGLGL